VRGHALRAGREHHLQHDSRSSATNLYALNVILHLYFEKGHARNGAGYDPLRVHPRGCRAPFNVAMVN